MLHDRPAVAARNQADPWMVSPGRQGMPWVRMFPAVQWAACMAPAAVDVRARDLVPECACALVWAIESLPAPVQFAMPPSKPEASPVRKLADVPDAPRYRMTSSGLNEADVLWVPPVFCSV